MAALARTSGVSGRKSLMWLDCGIAICLRGDLEAEEIEGSGLGWRGSGQDRGWAGVAEADAVAGQVSEVREECAEAVDGLAVLGASGDGLATRRGRDFGLGDGGCALSGGGFKVVVLKQHRGEVSLHPPDDVVGQHAQEDMGADAMGPAMVDRADVEVAGFDVAEAALGGAEAFIGEDEGGFGEAVSGKRASDHIYAVEGGFGGDRLGLAATM